MSELNPNYPEINEDIMAELTRKTAKNIQESPDELEKINWTDGEANLDTGYSVIACSSCEKAWNEIQQDYPKYNQIIIICKPSDISIIFRYPDGTEVERKIELKSSTSKKIPGSTIGKLNINQPLIFCHRTKDGKYIIKYSQYYTAMADKHNIELFQDRTPRPSICFDKMHDIDEETTFITKDKDKWIEHLAFCAYNRITNPKKCPKKSWQDELTKEITRLAIEDFIRNTSDEDFKLRKMQLQLKNMTI